MGKLYNIPLGAGELVAEERETAPDMKEMAVTLGAEYAEHVNVLFHGKRCHMFVDETGLLKNLPINERATKIYWAASLARKEKPDDTWSCIHGPAILLEDFKE